MVTREFADMLRNPKLIDETPSEAVVEGGELRPVPRWTALRGRYVFRDHTISASWQSTPEPTWWNKSPAVDPGNPKLVWQPARSA